MIQADGDHFRRFPSEPLTVTGPGEWDRLPPTPTIEDLWALVYGRCFYGGRHDELEFVVDGLPEHVKHAAAAIYLMAEAVDREVEGKAYSVMIRALGAAYPAGTWDPMPEAVSAPVIDQSVEKTDKRRPLGFIGTLNTEQAKGE